MDQDNPNYFDDHVAKCGGEPNSKSFFLFKKRSSTCRAPPIKSPNPNMTPLMTNKRSGSFKGLLRTRSNSNSSTTPKAAHYSREYNPSSYSEHDDVFYSNTIIPKCNDARTDTSKGEHSFGGEIELRRHSIGTFMMKEHFRFGSISDESGILSVIVNTFNDRSADALIIPIHSLYASSSARRRSPRSRPYRECAQGSV